MSIRDADEEFEFLVNLLASDGVDPDPPLGPGGVREGDVGHDRGLRIQRGSDGGLDLGQVRVFCESGSVGVGRGVGVKDGPGLTDHSRNHKGKDEDDTRLALEGYISVSRSVSDHEDRPVSPSSEPLTPTPHGTDPLDDSQRGQTKTQGSSPSIDDPGPWVGLLSEREAKQLLLEISDALKLRLPPDGDPRSATDRPRTLSEVRNVVEFLVKMDELVWRRSEYGANRGVFDSKNILAVEDHIRLWERIARGHSPE